MLPLQKQSLLMPMEGKAQWQTRQRLPQLPLPQTLSLAPVIALLAGTLWRMEREQLLLTRLASPSQLTRIYMPNGQQILDPRLQRLEIFLNPPARGQSVR
jgi:hypothetical protein